MPRSLVRLAMAIGTGFLATFLLISTGPGVGRAETPPAPRPTPPPAPQEATGNIVVPEDSQACVDCHRKENPGVVLQWEQSLHSGEEVGCYDCHKGKESDEYSWNHHGVWVTAVVTPRDCRKCHRNQYEEFMGSHHSQAAQHLLRKENVLGEQAGGMPTNNADAVSGCLQCHGSIVKLLRDDEGEIVRAGEEGRPVLDPETWPNSGDLSPEIWAS